MGTPFPSLFTPPRRRRVLWILAAATVITGVAQLPFLNDIADKGSGIIGFELAGSSAKARDIVSEWGGSGRASARASLYLDYLYLVSYGLFLAGACLAVADRATRLGWQTLARNGPAMAWAGLGAAACDAVENVALLAVASDHPNQPWPGIAFIFASAKFILSILASLYALGGFVATAVARPPRVAG